MAYEEAPRCITVEASGDLSAAQYLFMTINASGQLATTGDGLKTDGVLQNKPAAAGRAGTLAIDGVVKVRAGAAITAGDDVSVDASGRAVTAITGDVVAGRAMEDASGANVVVAVLLDKQKEPLS